MQIQSVTHRSACSLFKEIPYSEIIEQTNSLINESWSHLRKLTQLSFGPEYQGHRFHPGELIVHRCVKNWQTPDDTLEQERKQRTFNKWYLGECRVRDFVFSPTPHNRWILMRASSLLYKWLRGFKPSSEVEFTSGESYISSRGDVSLRQKLKLQEHWTVTYGASDAACELIWNCRALRAMAYQHLADKAWLLVIKASLAWKGSPKDLFVLMLQRYVLIHVCGSRYSEVPKNNEINRVISVEPTFNMLLQRQIGVGLRAVLKRVGNDVELGQMIHRQKIASPDAATIDWEDASNSHMLAQFRLMFPPAFVHMVERCRSNTILLPDGTQVVLHKLASMGNGFTFEVMTILLLAVARTLDNTSTVYGDDVIIRNNSALEYISACESLGWVVNRSKTFIDSPFRESCGAFFHDDYGYLKSFDISWCKNLNDVFITCNKLKTLISWLDGIAKTGPHLQHLVSLRELLQQTWLKVTSVVPSSFKGPSLLSHDYVRWMKSRSDNSHYQSRHITYSSSLNDSYVEYDNYEKVQRRNARCQRRFKSHRSIIQYISDRYQLTITGFVVCVSQKPTKVYRIHGDLDRAYDIYPAVSGMVDDCNGRETKNQFHVCAITESGELLSVDQIRASYRLEFVKHCGPQLHI